LVNELFEESVGLETKHLLAELKGFPQVAVLPYNDKPDVLIAAKKLSRGPGMSSRKNRNNGGRQYE
jgi:hypothetical protein